MNVFFVSEFEGFIHCSSHVLVAVFEIAFHQPNNIHKFLIVLLFFDALKHNSVVLVTSNFVFLFHYSSFVQSQRISRSVCSHYLNN